MIIRFVIQNTINFRPISHSLRTKRTTTPTSSTSDSKRLPEFTVPLRDKQSPAGATARLSCRVVSKSRLTAKWYKDGQPIRSGGRFDVQSDFASQTLVIRDCRVEDSGEYKCEAKNIDGVSSTVAMLTVQGMSLHLKSRGQLSTFRGEGRIESFGKTQSKMVRLCV